MIDYSKIRVLILGKTGTGKTFLLKKIMKKVTVKRFVVFDLNEEYNEQYKNDTIIFYDLKSFISFYNTYKKEEFCFIIRFKDEEEIETLLNLLTTQKKLMLIIDEASYFFQKNSKALQKILRFGRHNNIGFIAVSRRVFELSKELRALIYTIISFKQTEQTDLKQLEFLGLTNLNALKQYEYKKVDL